MMRASSPRGSRRGLTCLAAILACAALAGAANAQAPPPPATPDPAQLDRIERKLDEVLRRLEGGAGRAAQAASPALSSNAVPASGEADYRPGALAVVHAAPTRAAQLSEVPADSVGGFVYSGGALTLHDLSSRGVRYNGFAGVELQGWLKVAQAGRYQLGEEIRATLGPTVVGGPDCLLQAWLEDRAIGTERGQPVLSSGSREARASLVLGADLQPGLYKLRLWTACLPSRDTRIAAEILIKAPADLNLRGLTGEDILHQPR